MYGAQIKSSAYPLYLFGNVGVGDGKAMLIVAAALAALFGLTWVLLSRSFLQSRNLYRENRAQEI